MINAQKIINDIIGKNDIRVDKRCEMCGNPIYGKPRELRNMIVCDDCFEHATWRLSK